ncbi:winged helix DNA-binding domain-containing protein [Nocardioides sp. QY071]|uniref:winged helix DNA-binding domain-containing protein n=1 Tax=Nocardioides sp. QY071 TaxID=3044187 RepID=UPI00249AAAD9|nr:winged helix DNA-binding domain-containing protein [Nocardioides sp. QY071]WGY03990.1 winged helix DNA-binding domain-containing protein [Nocardioides sp. QY071]
MAGKVSTTVSTDEVIGFRLNAHHLMHRVASGQLLTVAGRCGLQNSPPGSALLALHARVRDVTEELMHTAVADDKSLLQTWSMRGAPFLFPTRDTPLFTTGVLPPTETALGHFLPGLAQATAKLTLSIDQAVEMCGAEIGSVLSGRQLAITELGEELAARVGPRLTPSQRVVWEGEGPFAPRQSLGEGIVHFCIRVLTLQQVVCFAARGGNKAQFVLVEEWLGQQVPDLAPGTARAELLRRYLRCYGPSTRADFAAWMGVNAGDIGPWWDPLQDELTPVGHAGRSWILTEDLDALTTAPRPEGVRMLPPRDPYTQLRDRETILDKKHHQQVWRSVGEPGAILADGRIVGTWRPRKSGRKLTITIESFDTLRTSDKKLLHHEATQIATLRGASSADVVFEAR